MDYTALMDLIRARRSIRTFTDEPVTHIQIEQLIEAARWAPSNHHRQAWRFIVFEDRQEIQQLADQVQRFLRDTLPHCHPLIQTQAQEIVLFSGVFQYAPVIILALHKPAPRAGQLLLKTACGPYVSGEVMSTAMACQNLLLAAHSLGLGACVMTAPLLAGPVWHGLKDLPPGYEPTCVIALGHPNETPDAPARKKLDFILEYRNQP